VACGRIGRRRTLFATARRWQWLVVHSGCHKGCASLACRLAVSLFERLAPVVCARLARQVRRRIVECIWRIAVGWLARSTWGVGAALDSDDARLADCS